MMPIAFVIGSPRSGTTLLGGVLDEHPQIAHWYEPVFVIDRYFKDRLTETRTASDATPEIAAYIRREFEYTYRKRGQKLVLDKNPFNSFKIPFLRAIFPEAKFIHMLRDGRDTTLSIRVEWDKRVRILSEPQSSLEAMQVFFDAVGRNQLLRHKLQWILFEIENPLNLMRGKRGMTHRGRRWQGHTGWGPRFEGWQDVINTIPSLQFNAMQWQACVEAILAQQPTLPADQFLEVRYENLLQCPESTLGQIFDFLGVSKPPNFLDQIPSIHTQNFNKWQSAFTVEEKALIGTVLQPTLHKLGYAKDDGWFSGSV